MNLESRVTVKDSSSFIPDDDAITDVCLSGNVTELHIVEKRFQNLRCIKRINQNEYCDTRTGEVREYRQQAGTCQRNMNHSFEQLRQLINANFIGKINERHVILTYSKQELDFNQVSKDFKKFWKRLIYHYADLEFIRVMEPHQNGAWHIHILIKRKQYRKLVLPVSQIEKLWGHGFVFIKAMKDCDNLGAYFTALVKRVDTADDTKNQTDGDSTGKSERLHFYPPHKRFYGYSRGIIQPVRFTTTYKKAMKYVEKKELVYASAKEVCLEYEDTKEKVAVNRIYRKHYNSRKM